MIKEDRIGPEVFLQCLLFLSDLGTKLITVHICVGEKKLEGNVQICFTHSIWKYLSLSMLIGSFLFVKRLLE